MKAELYWIDVPGPGRIAIMPRPRGGDRLDEEIQSYKDQGVSVLVSLLEPQEADELELAHEEEVASVAGLEFLSFSIPDRGVPASTVHVRSFVEHWDRLKGGGAIAVHCRAGIGRSALITGALLVLQGLPVTSALDRLTKARGMSVPETVEQRKWLDDFARS